jgi:hypothetical protein
MSRSRRSHDAIKTIRETVPVAVHKCERRDVREERSPIAGVKIGGRLDCMARARFADQQKLKLVVPVTLKIPIIYGGTRRNLTYPLFPVVQSFSSFVSRHQLPQ